MVQPAKEEATFGTQGEIKTVIQKPETPQNEKVQGVVLGIRSMVSAMHDVYGIRHPHDMKKISVPHFFDEVIDRMGFPELPKGTTPEMAQKLASFSQLIVNLSVERAGGRSVERFSHDSAEIFLIEGKVYVISKKELDNEKLDKLLQKDTSIPERFRPSQGEVVHLSQAEGKIIMEMSEQLAEEFKTAFEEAEKQEAKKGVSRSTVVTESSQKERKEVSHDKIRAAATIETIALGILASNLQKNQEHMEQIVENARKEERQRIKDERKEDEEHKIKDFKDILREAYKNDLELLALLARSLEEAHLKADHSKREALGSARDEHEDKKQTGYTTPGMNK